MQKLLIRAKQIVIFLTLWGAVTWFSAEITFAFLKDYINLSKDDLLGAACIAFIVVYAGIKPMMSHFQLKLWSRYILYFIIYTFLFLLISFI